MPIMDVAAFDFLAPAAESVAPAVFDTAAFEGLGAEAGLGATDFLGSMSGVNALENPAVAQQMANQQMAQGITSGGVGAAQGSAEQLALQQAKAAEIANSGIQQASKPLYEMTNQETNDFEWLTTKSSVIQDSKAIGQYKLLKTVDVKQLQEIYQRSDLVLARAGASTVSELAALKKPVVLKRRYKP